MTGARKGGKPGKFEIARGGTIFLDEIGDMDKLDWPGKQPKVRPWQTLYEKLKLELPKGLIKNRNNKKEAARILGIHRSVLYAS